MGWPARYARRDRLIRAMQFPTLTPPRRPDGKLDVSVVQLEMTEPPREQFVAPSAERQLEIRRLHCPSVGAYRRLYNGVGEQWLWQDRNRLDDERLEAIIQDERVEILVFYEAGVEAGFAELDLRAWPQLDIAYFGLLPSHIGRRLGRLFLHWIVAEGWARNPSKLRVNTCNLDHPAALPLYQTTGFKPLWMRTIPFQVDPQPAS